MVNISRHWLCPKKNIQYQEKKKLNYSSVHRLVSMSANDDPLPAFETISFYLHWTSYCLMVSKFTFFLVFRRLQDIQLSQSLRKGEVNYFSFLARVCLFHTKLLTFVFFTEVNFGCSILAQYKLSFKYCLHILIKFSSKLRTLVLCG